MKLINLLTRSGNSVFVICFLVSAMVFSLSSCGDENSTDDTNATDSIEQSDNPLQNQATQGGNAASSTLVQHYTCPKNCVGGGGSAAGNCSVCGEALVHNQEWHSPENMAARGETPPPTDNATPQGFDPSNPPAIDFKNQLNAPAAPQMDSPSPAQNAQGVWHYTCTAGCAGGAGSAGKCSKCGADLAHNQAYHN